MDQNYIDLSVNKVTALENEVVIATVAQPINTRNKKKLLMSLFALISIFFVGVSANAQVNLTATGGTLSQSYTTLKGAFDAINLGTHTGTITIGISGNTNESTLTAVLNGSGSGAASYTGLTISPTGGAARTITGATTAGATLIDLNGADNVTINGLNTGGNSLTIANTTVSATAGTSTIRFRTDATGNTITNCNLQGSATMAVGTNGGVVWFGDGVTTGNDTNTISFCNIGPAGANLPSKGIYFSGSSNNNPGTANSGIVINGNNVFNYFAPTVASAGIDMSCCGAGVVISNNKFYQTATRTQTTAAQHCAIRIDNTLTSSHQITGNTIGFASSSGTGTYNFVGVAGSTFVGIYLNVNTTTPATSVQGNTVKAIAISGASSGTESVAPFVGIYVFSGLTTVGNVTGNTIGDMSTTGSITYTSSSASTSDIIGIYNYFSSSNWTSNNNNVGGISVANSGSGASNVYGIRCDIDTALTWTCSNNTIGGNIANSISSSSTAPGTILQGLVCGFARTVMSSNTIRNLTAASVTGSTFSASVSGIVMGASNFANNTQLSINTIYNLRNTNTNGTATITGIQFSGGTGCIVERNFIYGLTNATNSGSAELNGIRVAQSFGSTIYRNNMIAIGNEVTNAFGTAPTNSSTSGINGFMGSVGADSFLHNTVYIGGAATSGSGPSYAFNSTQTTSTRSFRNNIFVNNRTNAGATGTHYIIKLNGTGVNPTGLTINNNVYFGTGSVFGFYNGLNVANLVAWRTAVGQDVNSFQSNPQLLNPTNALPDLHLHPSNITIAEGNGSNVGVTVDFDNQTRSTLTPVDIGADAGNFSPFEIIAPTITYTPLALTCSTGVRTLTATISDAGSGVPTAGAGLPVLYWRINAGAYVPVTATYVSGSTYTFTFGSGVVISDVVSYYIMAQDNLGNLSAFPAAGAIGFTSNPPIAVTPPSTPSSYNVGGSLSGTKTVGVGGNYATLTEAVVAYNNSCLNGAVVFSLTDAIYPSEVFPIVINANADSSAVNTLTIRPATGVASTIFGNSASNTTLIKLNGADYVSINGLNDGVSSLAIINTNTAGGGVIWIGSASASDGANNNSVQNCNINGTYNGFVATFAGIIAGSGTTLGSAAEAANNNNSITGNTFKATQNGVNIFGLASTLDQNWTVSTNLFGSTSFIEKHSFGGIIIANAQNFIIANNTIRGVVSTTSSSPTITGIRVAENVSGGTISGNKISDIKQLNSAGGGSNGIFLAATSTASAVTVFNNFISDVTAYGSTTATSAENGYGIMVNSGGGYNIYFNTVVMNTNQTFAGSVTAAINISATLPVGALNVRNNIFSNSQTVGTRYAIYNQSTAGPAVFSAINYNDYSAANVGYQTSARVTLTDWQTATGQDANSKAIAPVFAGGTDLHLIPASNSLLDGAATPIAGITTDIDNETRNVATPDMGADEFEILCTNAVGGTATGTNSFCLSVTNPPITATGYSVGVGTTYQWVFSTSSTNPVLAANVSGQNNPATLSTGLITATTYYWLKTTCATNSSTAYSNMVTITNNGPTPTFASGAGTFCQTTSISAIGGVGGTIYFQGTTSNGTSISLGGSPQTITTSGTYYFRSYDGICWGQQGIVAVVIVPNPTDVDATASVTDVCTGVPFNLFSTPGLPPTIILQQNFETGLAPWTAINTSTGGPNPALVIWAQQTTGYVYGSPPQTYNAPEGTKFAMANADAGGSGVTSYTTLTSPGFSTLGYSALSVSFKHYYRNLTNAAAFVEVSTNGTTWTTVQSYSATVGTPPAFATTSVNLNAYVGNANLYIRFRHSGGWEWYWAVDDIKISGTPIPYTYSWTSIPAGYTSSLQNPTGVTQSVATTYKVKVTGSFGCFTEDTISVGQAVCSSIVNLKLFIEGYYQGGGLMTTVQNNQDAPDFLLPPNTNVETITVELRHVSTYEIVASTTAMLKTDGTAICTFPTSPSGSFYIVVKTGNALQTWSATPQIIGSTVLNYDFTNSVSKAYGDNMTEMQPGVWAFYSGDINQDELVDPTDYSLWETDTNNFAFGVFVTDLNGDGNVDPTDYSIWEQNTNNFVYSIHP